MRYKCGDIATVILNTDIRRVNHSRHTELGRIGFPRTPIRLQ